MPSSFVESVPGVIHLLEKIVEGAPHPRIVDIGPGWGKYGLMAREYFAPDLLDAVEVPEGRTNGKLAGVQSMVYDHVLLGDAREMADDFWGTYDVALLIDVIEHMPLRHGHRLLKSIQGAGCHVIVSTPKVFEEQHDPANPYEEHVSLWSWREFKPHLIVADNSTVDSIIYWLGAR